jgi:hypothetical protein
MARRVASASEFFDILSSMKGGCFATIGYVTGANLAIPQVKRKNPDTGRMKNYDDYETFGKELGHDGEVGGIIKLTSYTLNWSTPESLGKAYKKYKADANTIRSEFGLEPIQDRESYKSTQAYGDNGVSTYSGNNDALSLHSYTAQNIHNARIKGNYYLIGTDGMVMREVNKDELVSYFKKASEMSGVAALRKMGATEERIQEYIDKMNGLGMSYKNFEASSILYMVATVNGEKIVYINENLTQSIRGINIIPAEFTKIAKERYQIDFATIQEAINEYLSKMQLNEGLNSNVKWLL